MVKNVYKSWDQKKVVGALFMEVKDAFDYVFRVKLAQQMRDFKIDNDLIGWIQSFLTDRKVKLVIDRHVNLKKQVKTGIPPSLPVSPILYLIYFSEVFDTVTTISLNSILLLFIDNLRFLVNRKSIYKIAADLEKFEK